MGASVPISLKAIQGQGDSYGDPVVDKTFIDAVASEIACSVDAAVEGWIAEIESVLQHPLLTDEDKLFSMQELITRYKYATGKTELRRRIN